MATEYDELRGNLMAQATHFSVHDETSLLLLKAADAIEDLQASVDGLTAQTIMVFEKTEGRTVIKFEPKWIPVTERLPEERTDVLAMTENCDIYVCDFIPSVRQFWTIPGDDLHITDISHWMPLPQPPEDGEP